MKDTPTLLAVSQGDAVELPCVANGFPLPVYSWSRDGADIFSAANDTFRSRFRLIGGNLILEGAAVSDRGQYVCTAENAIGSRTLSVKLDVIGTFVESYSDGLV